jgi:quinol monooxygenase YgiN
MLYEEWQSKEAFDAYRHSDFFKQNGQIFNPMFSAKPDSAYYQAERIKA